jgi:hypothetical protein
MEEGNHTEQEVPSGIRIFVTLLIISSLLALVYIVSGGYVEGWKWTGIIKDPSFRSRTFWDWLDILIVPAVVAVGIFLLDQRQKARERRMQIVQERHEQEMEERQRERELAVEEKRAQDTALQAYLDQMGA